MTTASKALSLGAGILFFLALIFSALTILPPESVYAWGGSSGNENTGGGRSCPNQGGGGTAGKGDQSGGGGGGGGGGTPVTVQNIACTLNVAPNPVTQGEDVTVTWSAGPGSVPIQIDGVAVTGAVTSGHVLNTANLTPGSHTFRISKSVTTGGVQSCTGNPWGRNYRCTTSARVTTNYNCSTAVTVDAASGPDLTADNITLNSGQLTAGKQVTFTGEIRNIGTLATPASFADQFSYRYEPSGSWVSVSNHSQSPLGIGADVNHVSSAISLATAGSISVRLCADSGSAIAEMSETNNCAIQPFTVANPTGPDIDLTIRETGTSAWLDETSINAGDQVELRWESSGADRCVGDAYFGTGGNTSGTQGNVSEPGDNSRVYTVTCYNDGDGTYNIDTAIVNVLPPSGDPTVTANPGRVKQGDPADITWNTNGNVNCVITGTNGDVFTPTTQTGTVTSTSINAETVYTISCETGNPNSSTVRILPVLEEI